MLYQCDECDKYVPELKSLELCDTCFKTLSRLIQKARTLLGEIDNDLMALEFSSIVRGSTYHNEVVKWLKEFDSLVPKKQ